MIKVRATQNGVYDGYEYLGPVTTEDETFPGEVFLVDEIPFVVKDEFGHPVQEMEATGKIDAVTGQEIMRPAWEMERDGKTPKKNEKGGAIPKYKMATKFSKTWMERVPNDTPLSYPDRKPFEIPEVYKAKKQRTGPEVLLSPEKPEPVNVL